MDPLILSEKNRTLGFYGLLILALLSALGTAKLSFDPPILKSERVELEIAAALAQGESYSAPAPVGWAKAISLGLGGVSLATGLGAIALSSARPVTLTTPLLNDVANPETPTTLNTLSDQQYQHQGQMITDKITALFDEHPWLEDVIDIEGSLMDLLIIIGMPGKGKSCLASSIGLLRKILHFCPLYIFDADADKNIRRGTWVTGQIAGLTEASALPGDYSHLAYKGQHDRMQASVLAELSTGQEPAVTVVYDELQRLSQNGFEPKAIQSHYEDYTAYRKRGDKVIYLWHESSKAGSGLSHLPKDSALLTDLLNYAAVIDFNAAPSPPPSRRRNRSKEKNSDLAMYKPAGVKYGKENLEPITIPKLLHPETLMEHLGSAAEYFDVRLSGYRDPGLAQRRAAIRDKVKRRLTGTDLDPQGNFKSSLEKLFSDPLTQHYLANKGAEPAEKFEDGFDLEGVPNRALFIELLQYLEHPARQRWADEQGFYPVRRITQGWALKKRGGEKRFSTTAAFRAFLTTFNTHGLGEWGDEGRTLWRGHRKASDFA